MTAPIVGVDFGTSNSAVALADGRVLPLPTSFLFRSVLFFPEDRPEDGRDYFAGEPAIEEYLQRSAGRFIQSVKSWLPSPSFSATQIRGKAYRLEELVAMLLRRIRLAAEAASGLSITRAVLGRPAVFSADAEREALAQRRLDEAARLAGFTEVQFLIEPIAAALAYEATLAKDERVLVADFGAGTSDLTLMRVGPTRRGGIDRGGDVIASHGVHVGGDRFDAEIMRHALLRKFGAGSSYEVMGKRMEVPMAILGKLCAWHEMSFIRDRTTLQLIDRIHHTSDDPPAIEALIDLVEENLGFHLFRAIEAAKIRLSSEDETRITYEEARVDIDEPLTRKELDRITAPLLGELDEAVTTALVGHDPSTIDAIFLTGGSSQIPSVRALFAKRFGEARLRSADAFVSVAEGLGRAAGALG